MSFIKKIVGSLLSIVCAIGCSTNDEQERKDLIKWLNHHISQISQQIENDIEKEKKGFYVHPDKTEYTSKGHIEYELAEKTGKRLEISERSLLTLDNLCKRKDVDVMFNNNILDEVDLVASRPYI